MGDGVMPVESHSRARENNRGALSPPILHVLRSRRERKEIWGEVSPHHPTRGSGEHRKLPQWGPGRSPGRPKMDSMHILGQKEAIWNTIFSIVERCRGPPNVAGPPKRRGAREKFFPSPPSRWAWMGLAEIQC